MKILYTYVAKQFLKIFAFTAVAFGFIVLISELFRQIGYYMEHDAGFIVVAEHLLSNVPWWIIEVLPVATLLALLFSLGDLSKKNEVTAMKAAGINMWRIISIFLVMGFLIGAADLASREFIIPKTTQFHEKITKEKIEKGNELAQTEFTNIVVSLPDNSRLAVGYLNAKDKVMRNIVLERYDENFYISKLVLAPNGFWDGGTWMLQNGVVRDFKVNMWDEQYFKDYDSGIHLRPEDLTIKKMGYELMDSKTFRKYITQLRIFGQTALKERIALNVRYASVFTHLIVMMIGIPFALGFGNKLGKILSFTMALGAAFVYWGTQAITQSLGENYILSPFMAAWLPNFIFIAIGVYLLAKVKK